MKLTAVCIGGACVC